MAETGEMMPEGGDGGAATGDAADKARGCRDLQNRKMGGRGSLSGRFRVFKRFFSKGAERRLLATRR